jgi:RNA polymerase sigma-70 factor (ECF subfamily)
MRMHGSDCEPRRLIEAIAEGSVEAFETIYDEYAPAVYRVCLHLLKNTAEAEDVCHDVFLEAWQKIDTYDASRGSIQAWLLVKARSRCLDYIRKQQRVLVSDEAAAGEAVSQEDMTSRAVFKRLDWQMVRKALDTLPEQQKLAVVASFLKGRSHQEIAREMARPLGSVKSMIRYGMRKLRRQAVRNGYLDVEGEERL